MIIIKSKIELLELINQLKTQGKIIGFVPTMGALHPGHLSLIQNSIKECDITVCSIFVNPTQFNNKEDFDKYPRDFSTDIEMLEEKKCDIIFIPSKEEMYPVEDKRTFNFGELENVMEGAHRPGHFNGVAQIVSKLFDAVPAHKAFFGQKDYQQYAIIKELVKQENYKIEIIACPIVREDSGLAMSSRNQRLSITDKEKSALIYSTLKWARANQSNYPVLELKKMVEEKFHEIDGLDLEYFDIVDDISLQPITNWEQEGIKIGCVAIFCGNIRLIDNIVFNL